MSGPEGFIGSVWKASVYVAQFGVTSGDGVRATPSLRGGSVDREWSYSFRRGLFRCRFGRNRAWTSFQLAGTTGRLLLSCRGVQLPSAILDQWDVTFGTTPKPALLTVVMSITQEGQVLPPEKREEPEPDGNPDYEVRRKWEIDVGHQSRWKLCCLIAMTGCSSGPQLGLTGRWGLGR